MQMPSFLQLVCSSDLKVFRPLLSANIGIQVSSESGWSPNPELLAKRKYVKTSWGWFPKEDAFGGGEFITSLD